LLFFSFSFLLKDPVYRGFSLRRKQGVCLREMTAAEKGTAGKRRRMGSFEHMVAGPVDQGTLAPCEIAPKKEDHSLAIA
jgi:hypothetical protein